LFQYRDDGLTVDNILEKFVLIRKIFLPNRWEISKIVRNQGKWTNSRRVFNGFGRFITI
jgi:hypothetical protein